MLHEPVRGVLAAPSYYSMSGIDHARAWLRGTLPATPLARLCGYRPTQVASGSATLTMPATPWLQFGEGTVDLKILIEEAMCIAVLSGSPAGIRFVPAAMSVHHLRPSTVESGSFVARARVITTGSAFTTAEVLVEDSLGRATAQVVGSVLPRTVDPAPSPHDPTPYEEPVYSTPDPPLRPDVPRRTDVSMREGVVGDIEGTFEAPITRLLGLRYREFNDDGSGVCSMPASPWLCSRWSDVQHGAIGTLMQMGLGASIMPETTGNEYIGIVSQNLTFLGEVPADGRDIVGRFQLVHRGELLVSQIEVLDADGNRVGMGTQTSVIRERRRRGAANAPGERVLATVLFTDIVASTERVQELGDEAWREVLTEHQELVRRQLKAFEGREIKTIGDGFLATFESPTRAVQCARAVRDAVQSLGIEIRAGVHTGECERIGADLTGIAVHAASRIESAAGPGEILVSSTVHDLVAGSGLNFADRGLHELKGLSGQRQLFAVTS